MKTMKKNQGTLQTTVRQAARAATATRALNEQQEASEIYARLLACLFGVIPWYRLKFLCPTRPTCEQLTGELRARSMQLISGLQVTVTGNLYT
jgi:hypothetical protein